MSGEKKIKNKKEVFLFHWKKWLKSYFVITICAMFFSFGIVFILNKTESLPSGVTAIASSLSLYFDVISPYIQLIVLALNIPLIIIFWNKINRNFMYKTIYFLSCNSIFGFIFGIDVISQQISSFFIIGKETNTDIIKNSWEGFIYSLLAITICGTSAGFAWKYGASTGGTDILSLFFSTKYRKNVGVFLIVSSIIITTIALIILNSLKFGKNEGFSFSQIVNSFMYLFFVPVVVNFIYPKYKKLRIRINSQKIEEITTHLKETKFPHPYHISKTISGFNNNESVFIESVILLAELRNLRTEIKLIDEKSWISTVEIYSVHGVFNYKNLD